MIKYESNEVYHAEEKHISSSKLKKYKKSPANAKYSKMEETKSMKFGTAYHTYILEPDDFHKEYCVLYSDNRPEPSKNMNSKLNKEWKLELETKYNLLTIDEYNDIMRMKEKLFSNPYAKYLLTGGEGELSFYNKINGVNVKCRADHFLKDKKIIVDLKTTTDAREEKFKWTSSDYGYHISAAFYTDIIEKEFKNEGYDFFIIAQEKAAPYDYSIFKASEQFLAIGRYEYEELLQMHRKCEENNHWGGYEVFCDNKYGITELNVPPSKIKELKYYI